MLRLLILTLLSLFLWCLHAEDLKDEVRFKYQYYDDNNRVQVRTPLVQVQKTVGKYWGIGAHFTVDGITGASRTSQYATLDVDAITSASKTETRRELGIKLKHHRQNSRISLSGVKSDENDYSSRSGFINLSQDVFRKNGTLNLNYGFFHDQFNPDTLSSTFTSADNQYSPDASGLFNRGQKTIHSTSLGYTHSLTNRTLASLSGSGTWSRGYLGRPYYYVLVEDSENPANGGTLYLESYPRKRDAYAAVASLRQHYPSLIREGSLKLEYRFCWDNWSVYSYTYDALINQYLLQNIYIQLGYRLYLQDQASFYRDRYTEQNTTRGNSSFLSYLTVDPRFADYYSQLIKAKMVFLFKNFIRPDTKGHPALFPARFDFEVSRYFRSTSKDAEVRRRRYESYGENGLAAWIIRGGLVFYY
ncbi:MAG: DUF3570 domain-containing protein [Fibrobacteria bacterium]|nr:DUF3570 domain-containing protein [Fibrobacteria bacterium]